MHATPANACFTAPAAAGGLGLPVLGWLTQLHDCLDHLALLNGDDEAASALRYALVRLHATAQASGLAGVAQFAAAVALALAASPSPWHQDGNSRGVLRQCLDLMAWQVELADPTTGELNLDQQEQQQLLTELRDTLAGRQLNLPLPGWAFERRAV
ncbi:hypothetical protein [Pseudomonas sp. NPDC007930]|uniref:hypothetical protein n=1 Tax=Pseudomonas sp. NPDC007930 TaxID=3364417 RepID=UPI0036E56A71